MSDDLVKRLEVFANGCRGSMWQSRDKTIDLMDEAAARIRELEAELAALREARALTNELLTLLSRLGPIGPSHCRYHNKWYRVDDVVNDLRNALEPAPVTPAEAWQPIETAPKDGFPIIGWVKGWNPTQMHYCATGNGWNADQPGWYDLFNDIWAKPTHWRPMPKPPRALADTGEAGE